MAPFAQAFKWAAKTNEVPTTADLIGHQGLHTCAEELSVARLMQRWIVLAAPFPFASPLSVSRQKTQITGQVSGYGLCDAV